ncbi:MAG TPA: class I SAM-dependent methyltransferase [Steroidobacteraceae bacterium]|jgi:SAM-dependent methyltransferase|nr:class I SAM-dependent methyltransferase [Steroidobacteraceae bacterium]
MDVAGVVPSRARFAIPPSRNAADVEHHYRVEVELAQRLRSAPRAERLGLYGQVYDELFRRVPNHPQLTRKVSEAERRKGVADRIATLLPFIGPDTVFLEIGAGDGSLTLAVAERARHCYALDVSREILSGVQHPRIETVLSDGCSVPVPPGSVTLAYSFQVMEHIHPDDALEQLHCLYDAIAPGGSYLCITPNRLNGPHDVSKFFDTVARGFHLKEYTTTELAQLFREIGFRRVEVYARTTGRVFRLPLAFVKGFEKVFEWLPAGWRSRLGRRRFVRSVLAPALRAVK